MTDVSMASDHEAEAAVLGAIVLDSDALAVVRGILSADDFDHPPHRALFAAAIDLADHGISVDPITLRARAISRNGIATGELDIASAAIIDAVPTAANVSHHAQLVRHAAKLRELIRLGQTMIAEARRSFRSAKAIALTAQDGLLRIVSDRAISAETARTRWRLDELLTQPDLLEPPAIVIPRIAWRSRSTLLASSEKLGKSTFLSYVAAQASRGGDVLGLQCAAVDVLVFGLEEFIGDVVRRLARFDAEPTRVHIVTTLPDRPAAALSELRRHVVESSATLVIVDTLIAYAAGGVTDANASAQMQPIVQALSHYAHESGVALILVHHGRKSDGKYRDSSAIGGGVDVIIELAPPKGEDESTTRVARVRGRVPTADFQFRYEHGTFELVSASDVGAARDIAATLGAISAADSALAQKIADVIAVAPGASMKGVRDRVAARSADIDRMLTRLIDSGRIVDAGSVHAHRYYLAESAPMSLPDNAGTRGQPTSSDGTSPGQGADNPADNPAVALGGLSRPPIGGPDNLTPDGRADEDAS